MTDVEKEMQIFLDASFDWLIMPSHSPDGNGNVFAHDLPPTPDSAVALIGYEGQEPVETMGNSRMLLRPRVQVTIRDPLSVAALNNARQIRDLMTNVKDQYLFPGSARYQRITATGEPFEIGPDSQQRQRAQVNFAIAYYG